MVKITDEGVHTLLAVQADALSVGSCYIFLYVLHQESVHMISSPHT